MFDKIVDAQGNEKMAGQAQGPVFRIEGIDLQTGNYGLIVNDDYKVFTKHFNIVR